MHIAICDDNVADRKQSERLLSRESDSRLHTTGVLYIDSFGNSEALLKAPMLYDLFFIDMTTEQLHGLALAQKLREVGVMAPIVLCSSAINYSAMSDQPDHIYHLQKPLKAEAIKNCVDTALSIRSQLERTIEIRCEQETHYVSPDHIVLATPSGHLTEIQFEDGKTLKMLGTLDSFFALAESTDKFLYAKKNLLVNTDYVDYYTLRKLQLKNGQSFSLNLADWRYLKKHCPTLQK